MDARDLDDPVGAPPAGRWLTPSCLDLSELDIDDGPAMARLVTQLRELARQRGSLCLRDCPQMLAHTLYKIGALSEGLIVLESPREEEPHG